MFVGGVCVRVCVSNESEYEREVHNKREWQRGGGDRERGAGRGIEYAYVKILTLQFGSRGQPDSERLGVIYHSELSKEDLAVALPPPPLL